MNAIFISVEAQRRSRELSAIFSTEKRIAAFLFSENFAHSRAAQARHFPQVDTAPIWFYFFFLKGNVSEAERRSEKMRCKRFPVDAPICYFLGN
jgi:hypothetical protein